MKNSKFWTRPISSHATARLPLRAEQVKRGFFFLRSAEQPVRLRPLIKYIRAAAVKVENELKIGSVAACRSFVDKVDR